MIRKASYLDISRIKNSAWFSELSMFDWLENFDGIESSVLKKCCVFVDKHQIKGIIAIDNNCLCLCVSKTNDKIKNIEAKLLKYMLRQRNQLHISLSASNAKSVNFFHSQGFKIIQEIKNENNNKTKLIMSWALGCPKSRLVRLRGDS